VHTQTQTDKETDLSCSNMAVKAINSNEMVVSRVVVDLGDDHIDARRDQEVALK
jgi:hypothetical protein